MNDFYDRLVPFYILIYLDWEGTIAQQSIQLFSLIWKRVTILSCGPSNF